MIRWIYRLFLSADQHAPHLRRGFSLLLLLVGGSLLSLQLWRHYRLRAVEVDTTDYLALREWVLGLRDSIRLKNSKNWHGIEQIKLPPEDLNQATALELQRVKGIGRVLARRIVIKREALGGFHSWSQLSSIRSLYPRTLEQLAHRFQLITPPKLLHINHLDRSSLILHPYIDDTLALRIIKHRPFKDLEALKTQTNASSEQLTRLQPYLSYE